MTEAATAPPPGTSSDEDGSPSIIRARRLVSIRQKWEDGVGTVYFQKLPTQDLIDSGIPIEELEKNGLLKAARDEQIPAQVGVREMAKYLNQIYPRRDGVEIYPMQVSNAIHKEGAPGLGKNNRINSAPFLVWWNEHKFDGAPAGSKLAAAADAVHDLEIIQRDLAQIRLDDKRREMDDRWMQKGDAQMTVTAAVLSHHTFVKNRLSKFTQKLNAQDFAPDQLEKINLALMEVLNEIETDCECA
jgi:hypothetical protein